MEQKNQPHAAGQPAGPDMRAASEMQEDNANGARQNEQGQASFFTGTTIGGGSNFGQGSSHLGSNSYQQGSRTGTGSNYDNEAEGLGRSNADPIDENLPAPIAGQPANNLEGGTNPDTRFKPRSELHAGRADLGSGRPRSGSWSQSSTEGE
jgi:hypothetical protein